MHLRAAGLHFRRMITYHTAESLAEWNAAEEHDPAMAKLRELTVEYVTAQGGLTLDVWQLNMGHWFSTNVMMTTAESPTSSASPSCWPSTSSGRPTP